MSKGHIRKYKDRWAGIVELPRDESGKRKQKWIYGDSEKEVQKKINELKYKIDTNNFNDASKLSCSAFFDRWLSERKSALAPKTYESYEYVLRYHVKPELGNIIIDKLKPLTIQTYYTNKLATLSPTTVLYHHRILHKALKQAVQWGIINRNPVENVEPPKKATVERRVWDLEQLASMLDFTEKTVMFLPILLATTTGMREGEICGLRWQDIDLETGLINCTNTLQRINHTLTLRTRSRTDSKSSKTILVMKDMIDVLKLHKKAQDRNKKYFETEYIDGGYVCCWQDGLCLDPVFISHKWPKLIKAYNLAKPEEPLPKIVFHDLRHSNATELMSSGINPKIVSERLGHSRVQITLDTYSHVMPNMQEQAATIIEQSIFSRLKRSK